MTRRRPNDRHTDSDIHRIIKCKHLNRYQPLIVIHRHNPVKLTAYRPPEKRIRRKRPAAVYPNLASQHDRRAYYPLLFVTELTILARMRIKTGNSYLRSLDPEVINKRGIEQIDRFENAPYRKLMPKFKQTLMNSRKSKLQRPRNKHHHLTQRLASIGYHLRMPRPHAARQLPTNLTDRRRSHPVDNTGPARIYRVKTKPHRRLTGNLIRLMHPRLHGVIVIIGYDHPPRIIPAKFFMRILQPERIHLDRIGGICKRLIHSEYNKLRQFTNPRIRQRLNDYLRPDTARIAHRYPDNRLGPDQFISTIIHKQSTR